MAIPDIDKYIHTFTDIMQLFWLAFENSPSNTTIHIREPIQGNLKKITIPFLGGKTESYWKDGNKSTMIHLSLLLQLVCNYSF
jgi:hypothetical protein